MAVVHFQYPHAGPVYAINTDEMTLAQQLVHLPGGKHVRVTLEKDRFPFVEDLHSGSGLETAWKAHVVISQDGFEKVFMGDWEPLAALINAAADVNTLFTVIMPVAEYEKLKNEPVERLRLQDLLSERANSLIRLCGPDEVWHDTGGLPTLELLRTGRCP